MMNSFTFTIPGKPRGKARARTVRQKGKSRTYTPEQTAMYEQAVQWTYKAAGGPHFGESPVAITIRAFFGVPKSASKRNRDNMLADAIKPTIRPDADNIQKLICDALNGVAYEDDKQVVSSSVIKMYAQYPCVHVEIEKANYEIQGV